MHHQIFHAPVKDPRLIVDVGCGTGIVTRLLGSTYPHAEHVYGVDLSPVPPARDFSYLAKPGTAAFAFAKKSSRESGNLTFIEGDFNALTANPDPRFLPGTFDYLFSRLLVAAIDDWPKHVTRAYRLLKPGGWCEMHDIAFRTTRIHGPSSGEWDWMQVLIETAATKGFDFQAGEHVEGYMRAAGFVDVQVKRYEFPFSLEDADESQKRISAAFIRDLWGLFWFLIPSILKPAGYNQGKIEEYRAAMRHDLRAETGKWLNFWVVWGRKPNETIKAKL